MKNVVLKVALGLSLASATALAQGAFIGIEGDYSFNSKLTAKSDNDTTKVKKAQPGIGLKAGYDFDSFRVYGAYLHKHSHPSTYSLNDSLLHHSSLQDRYFYHQQYKYY